MEDIEETISRRLKIFKQQGLSYYQATQKLKEQGYTDEQISIASASFSYTDAVSTSLENRRGDLQNPMLQPDQTDMSKSEEDLGRTLLKDQQNTAFSSKFFIYASLFIAGFGFGWGLMRLYLVPHWFNPSGPNIFTHSSSYNYSLTIRYTYTYPALAGAAGGLAVTLIYGIYKLLTSHLDG